MGVCEKRNHIVGVEHFFIFIILRVRLSEHKSEIKKVESKKFTRAERKIFEHEQQTKSAISDHAARANHVIDWDEVKIIGREHDKIREVREAMEIRKREAKVFNREEGTYLLSHAYDPLLSRNLTPEMKRQQVSRQVPF